MFSGLRHEFTGRQYVVLTFIHTKLQLCIYTMYVFVCEHSISCSVKSCTPWRMVLVRWGSCMKRGDSWLWNRAGWLCPTHHAVCEWQLNGAPGRCTPPLHVSCVSTVFALSIYLHSLSSTHTHTPIPPFSAQLSIGDQSKQLCHHLQWPWPQHSHIHTHSHTS